MNIESALKFSDNGTLDDWLVERGALTSLAAEVRRLSDRVLQLIELREGDFQLTRALAKDAGIKITASDKLPGAQWEQFHAGVMALKGVPDPMEIGWPVWKGHWVPCLLCPAWGFCKFCAGSGRIRIWEAPGVKP